MVDEKQIRIGRQTNIKTFTKHYLEFVGKKFATSYEESNNTVLFQECVRYNRLLADMKVGLINDGPVTIWMDTKRREG